MNTSRKNSATSGMVSILGAFVGILIYKAFVHGRHDAIMFLPFVALWVLATVVVYWFSRRRNRAAT